MIYQLITTQQLAAIVGGNSKATNANDQQVEPDASDTADMISFIIKSSVVLGFILMGFFINREGPKAKNKRQ